MTINGENLRKLSNIELQNYITEIQDELDKRELSDACQHEHKNLSKAIEDFQRSGYNSVLITNGGIFVPIQEINEIYNPDLCCGFVIGIDCETTEVKNN